MLECMVIEHERDGPPARRVERGAAGMCLMMGGLLSMMMYVLSGARSVRRQMRQISTSGRVS